jgi:hypothetical protein
MFCRYSDWLNFGEGVLDPVRRTLRLIRGLAQMIEALRIDALGFGGALVRRERQQIVVTVATGIADGFLAG